MARKLVLTAMTIALSIGFLATIGSEVASAMPHVTFSGSTNCASKMTAMITPRATLTSTGPYTVKFKGSNASCLPSLTVSGATLKKGRDTATLTIPVGAAGAFCTDLQTSGANLPPFSSFRVGWYGRDAYITPSTVTYATGATINPAGTIAGGSSTVVGSFSSVTFSLVYSVAAAAKGCGSAMGLKRLVLNGTVSTS